MLKHFAQHVTATQVNKQEEKSNSKQKRTSIPDLYPIKTKNNINNPDRSTNKQESDENGDSGFEDVNPAKFCQVTMEDKKDKTKESRYGSESTDKCQVRRFVCIYCTKTFRWGTDFKRHLLIHTGERPFKCEQCKLSFTRNFLLKRHKLKCHANNNVLFNAVKMKIPLLKPLEVPIKHKARKQDKCNIKRKMCSTKVVYQSNLKNLICNI